MILHLNKQLFESAKSQKQFYDFLRNVMLAYVEGKHFLVIDARSAKGLISDNQLDEVTRTHLIHYLSHSKGAETALSYFKVVVEIVANDRDEQRVFDPIKKTEVRRLRYTRFLDSSTIQKTILLGENANDAEVYARFAQYYTATHIGDKFPLVYTKRGGGGSTVVNEYKEIYNNHENFCICILDSDKRNKQKTYGHTARKVAKFHNTKTEKNFRCEYLILPVLEIENLLPEKFYTTRYESKYPNEIFPSIRRMEAFDKHVRKYFDFKTGVKGFSNQTDEGTILYWWELISCARIKSLHVDENSWCYVRGFGDGILSEFLKISPTSLHDIINSDPIMKKIWSRMGSYIASFLIANQPIRAM